MNMKTFATMVSLSGLVSGLAPAQSTTRLSLTDGGAQLSGASYVGPISSDGRYVAFRTNVNGVVAGDSNGAHDGFVIDRASGTYDWVTVGAVGTAGDGDSAVMDMTPDARFVVIQSTSTNLVAGDGNGRVDVFVRDRQ